MAVASRPIQTRRKTLSGTIQNERKEPVAAPGWFGDYFFGRSTTFSSKNMTKNTSSLT
jgi:hypothetical protein